MKIKIPFLFLLFLSCQGPWSYWPENPENYRGIWIYAYIVSGRPVENVCLDKLHSLKEVRMHGFAFYESADIQVSGSFNGKDTSFSLEPYPAGYAENPNCFAGPANLFAEAGKDYELEASIAWDSAGKRVVSKFNATTYIPKRLKILRAYDLERNQYGPGDTVLYLPPPMDLQSNYFVPEYSDDVGGILVSIVYNRNIFWGENSIDALLERMNIERNDTAEHAFFGDRRTVFSARNQQIGNINKAIDSIPVVAINLPAIGNANLLFYATTPEYFKFEETFLRNRNDSRIEPVYNINNGAGIFAGMLVDTFEVNFKTPDSVRIYPYLAAQEDYCSQLDVDTNVPYRILHRECIEIWDKKIWRDFSCMGYNLCHVNISSPWYSIPPEALKMVLSPQEIVTWCGHRDFPIKQYPLCGSAMVHYSRSGKSSPVLDREVKKWCEEHPTDVECLLYSQL